MIGTSALVLLNAVLLLQLTLARGDPGEVGPTPRAADLVGPTLPSECEKHCDVRRCPVITKEICSGRIVKDKCDCCPHCENGVTDAPIVREWTLPSSNTTMQEEKCKNVVCPKQKICMVNIQGLPLCRCPSLYVCQRLVRPICSKDGKTYMSRCHMRISACNKGRRLQMEHRGQCANDPLDLKKLSRKQRRLYDLFLKRSAFKKSSGGQKKSNPKQVSKKKTGNKARLDRKRKKKMKKRRKQQQQKKKNKKKKLNRRRLYMKQLRRRLHFI